MDETSLLQLLQTGLSFTESIVPSVIGTMLTSLFLRCNTSTSEFEKIKARHFDEALTDLIKSGKMTYAEFNKFRNFRKIAELADQQIKSDPSIDQSKERIYEFDWFTRFYEYAGNISNTDMQLLWSKLLAGELNSPGSVSYSLMHALYMMRKEEASVFENICRFVLRDINQQPHLFLYVTKNRAIYARRNITPSSLKNLERLGLIECDFTHEYAFQHENEFVRYNDLRVKKIFRTGNKQITVYSDPDSSNSIQVGNVVFTQDGEMLYSILDDEVKKYRGDILEFIVERLTNRNCQVMINDRIV